MVNSLLSRIDGINTKDSGKTKANDKEQMAFIEKISNLHVKSPSLSRKNSDKKDDDALEDITLIETARSDYNAFVNKDTKKEVDENPPTS